MAQSTPTPSPSPPPLSPPDADALQRYSAEREHRQAGHMAALHEATSGGLVVLAILGEDEGVRGKWGSAAYLAREEATGALVVAALNERVSTSGGYDVTLWRELEELLPGPASWCPHCGTLIDGWMRFCGCGTDLSGIAPGTEEDRAQLLEHARHATAGEFELLGVLPYASGGGLAYFARQVEGRAVVALRMHADGSFDDGTQRISLSVSEPLVEMGVSASSSVTTEPVSISMVTRLASILLGVRSIVPVNCLNEPL